VALDAVLQPPAPVFGGFNPTPSPTGLTNHFAPLSFGNDSGYAEPESGATVPTKETSGSVSAGPDQPAVSYWFVWADQNGVSHQTHRELSVVDSKSDSTDTPAESMGRSIGAVDKIAVVVRPAGWVSEWHETPTPQWDVPLFGRWFVETMDGTRVEMGPGDASFAYDPHTIPDAEGRTGHRSGTVGNQPAVVLIIQTGQDFDAGQPDR
jgi:hypothetical protein